MRGRAAEEALGSELGRAWEVLAPEEARTLMLLHERHAPVGARIITSELAAAGVMTSEASVSRMLVRLDELGLTRQVGRKGRVLTSSGIETVTTALTNHRRNAGFSQALRIRSVEQLMDLLSARRGVEREVARAAAMRRTSEQLDQLEAIVDRHRAALTSGDDPSPSGMEFHRLIVRMAGGELFTALGEVVLSESLLPLEKILDVITGGSGTLGRSAPEHGPIIEAIRRQDAEGASRAMDDHLSRLIADVDAFASNGNGELFERLLRLAR